MARERGLRGQTGRQPGWLNSTAAFASLQFGGVAKKFGRWQTAEAAYRRALAFNPHCFDATIRVMALTRRRRLLASARAGGQPRHLRNVVIGTTGLCNASCLACPTGKPETQHVPRVPMTMALFEKLLRGIADLDLVITDQISFGLFGDGLADPFVLDRAVLARKLLPDARLVVNTNGAAYDPKRHARLIDSASFVVLHIESLEPATYETLMAPLRAERVFPKIEQMLRDFPGRIIVSVPVSRANLRELPRLRRYFRKRGVHQVVFDPLSNRCSEKPEPFRRLALDPVPIRCPSSILEDLIVDCDGRVLVCCQDFARQEEIGDLNEETLAGVLANRKRGAVRERFEGGRHTEMKTCRNCQADLRGLAQNRLVRAGLSLLRGGRAGSGWVSAGLGKIVVATRKRPQQPREPSFRPPLNPV